MSSGDKRRFGGATHNPTDRSSVGGPGQVRFAWDSANINGTSDVQGTISNEGTTVNTNTTVTALNQGGMLTGTGDVTVTNCLGRASGRITDPDAFIARGTTHISPIAELDGTRRINSRLQAVSGSFGLFLRCSRWDGIVTSQDP